MTNHDVGSHDFMHSLYWNYELPHGVIALSEFPRGPSVEDLKLLNPDLLVGVGRSFDEGICNLASKYCHDNNGIKSKVFWLMLLRQVNRLDQGRLG